MSTLHPIISITGSSGAGTTSVKRTFEQIFRREKIDAAFIEGDAFHRYDRAAMKAKVAEEEARGNPNFSHFSAGGEPARDARGGLRGVRPSGHRPHPNTTSTTPRRRRSTASPPAPSPPGRDFEPQRPPVLRGPARLRRHRQGQPRAARRPQDRRGAGRQPRMDPEDPPRPRHPRLLDRGGHRHDPAPDARLRPLHLPAVHRRRDINFQRVPIVDTSNPFIARWIPTPDELMVVIRFAQSARHRLPLPALDDPRQLHVAAPTRSWCRAASSTSPCS